MEPAEGDLVRVLLAHVQAEPSNDHHRKRRKDTATGRASDALAVEVNVVSTVALPRDNIPKRRLERRRERLLEGAEHALVERGKYDYLPILKSPS